MENQQNSGQEFFLHRDANGDVWYTFKVSERDLHMLFSPSGTPMPVSQGEKLHSQFPDSLNDEESFF